MNCPTPEALLAFAKGNGPADLGDHIAACAQCRSALAELGSFESRIAGSHSLPADERTRLRSITERLLSARPPQLQQAPQPIAARRHSTIAFVLLAALLLTTLLLWPQTSGITGLDVHCYPPDGTTRADRIERFSLSLQVGAPRWLVVWQIGAAGSKRLLPDANAPLPTYGVTFPLAKGAHRVPASDLLDFEYSTTQAPRQLIVVPLATEPDTALLAELDRLVAGNDAEAAFAELMRRHPEARRIEFPRR